MSWAEPIVVPPGPRSWWLREALANDPGEPCPPLRGDVTADIVVIGGGYTGLWSAFFATQLEPSADVVVLEQDICGGGPSGRNGGFVTGWWDELADLVALYGERGGVATAHAVGGAVAAVGVWCRDNGVDAWFSRPGYIATACSAAQEGFEAENVRLARAFGVENELVPLTSDQVRALCGSPVFGPGALMRDGGDFGRS